MDDEEAATLEHDRRVPTRHAAREARIEAHVGGVDLARGLAERDAADPDLARRQRAIEVTPPNPVLEYLSKRRHGVLYPVRVPERPDLEYLVPRLDEELRGAAIADVAVHKPVVVRVAVPGTPKELLSGRTFAGVARHGAFVAFELRPADVFLAIHPMLAGRFWLGPAQDKRAADTAVTLALADGRELRYRDDKQMGKFWLVDPARVDAIPKWGAVGVDVLSEAFDRARFGALARGRKDQCKLFLLDHAALDHLGNAYADEALWTAGIHPKTRMAELDAAQLDALYAAIIGVLTRSRDEIRRRAPPLHEKLRDFLAVRGKKGQPCPRCSAPIRTCGVLGHDAFFCPTCQPEGKRKGFVDWSKLR